MTDSSASQRAHVTSASSFPLHNKPTFHSEPTKSSNVNLRSSSGSGAGAAAASGSGAVVCSSSGMF